MSSGNIRKQQYEQELKMQRERELAKKIAAEQLRKTVPVPNAPTGLMTPPLPAPPPNQPVEDHSYKIFTDSEGRTLTYEDNEAKKQNLRDLGSSEEEVSRMNEPNPAGHFQSRSGGKSYYETGPMPQGPLRRINPDFRKTPTGNEIMMDNARGLMDDPLGSIDRGVGQFFGEDGPIDSAKKSQIGQLLGGFLKHAGGLMSDPELRGFAGMMDEGSYYDEKGYYGGAGQGLATAGGLYDAAAGAGAKRMEARAKAMLAAGGGRLDRTPKGLRNGLEATEVYDSSGKKKYMITVPKNMQPKQVDLGGESVFQSPYKPKALDSLMNRPFQTIESANNAINEVNQRYGGNILNLGQRLVKEPTMAQQHKMLDEMRNANESLRMLHTVLGTSHDQRLKTGGLLKESFTGLGGKAVAGVAGGVAELAQLTGQPNWLQDTKAGKTRELQTVMSKVKAGLWRSLVGRGQLSAADYKFIDDNLGVFTWGKDEGLVRFSLSKVVERLERVIAMNGYLMGKGKRTKEAQALEYAKYDAGQDSLISEGARVMDMGGQYAIGKSASKNDDLSRGLFPKSAEEWAKKKNKSNAGVMSSYGGYVNTGGKPKNLGVPNYAKGTPQGSLSQDEKYNSIIEAIKSGAL